MTSDPSVTAEVEVGVDPRAAFQVFTEEMGRWWTPGPINFWDSARAVEMRCEPGVGGRLIEVYDATTGEGLELGRFTVWEPGERLVWQSSVDDVETTVRFVTVPRGTRVVVEARVPEGGRDEGGSAWVRVAPSWFGAWCARRHGAVEGRPLLSRLGVTVFYDKPAVAARWISQILGTDPTLPLPGEDEAEPWIEFRVGDGLLVALRGEEESRETDPPTHIPWIFVDDLDAHYESTSAAGMKIIEPIFHHGYRAYTIEDPAGYRWTIAQALPSVVHPGESVVAHTS